jgi:energy-coupling factor transporter ATP-binding protein EcfA2
MDNNLYIVKLSKDTTDNLENKSREVVIFNVSDSWNDFGHKTSYSFIAKDINGKDFQGRIFIGYFDKKILKDEEEYTFFSMLPTMGDYRKLIHEVGEIEAAIFLDSIIDLVKLQKDYSKSNLLKAAQETEEFKLSFMRNSENFFTFHNAGSILDGLEKESIEGISTTLELNFQLDAFVNEHNFSFNFDLNSVLPKRICAIIGKNGIGKSQALYSLVHKALENDENLIDPNNKRPMINRLLAIATPGETKNTFPVEKPNSRVHYSRLLLTRDSNSKFLRGTGHLLIQLVRSEESIKKQNRWELFCKALENILDLDELVIPLNSELIASRRYVKKIANNYYIGLKNIALLREQESLEIWAAISDNAKPLFLKNDKVFPLSSGQISFYLFSLQACLMIENATLVLLDEPETHLHPNLISDFVVLLDRLLELTGSIAIVATHSAYFIRELPRSQVHVMKEIDNHIEINQPRLKTFGADVGAISYFVFEDEITNRLIKKVKKSLEENQSSYKELEDELSLEAIMHLKKYFSESHSE